MLMQNCLIYKLIIDIHESYAKLFGSPLFKFYKNEVIPLALDFYSKIDKECLQLNMEALKGLAKGIVCKLSTN